MVLTMLTISNMQIVLDKNITDEHKEQTQLDLKIKLEM